MQNLKRAIALALLVVMSLGAMIGCSAVNANPVVGKVGDVDLTLAAYTSVLNGLKQYYDYGALELKDPDHPLEELKQMAFDDLVDSMIPVAIAKRDGVTLTAEEETALAEEVQSQIQTNLDQTTEYIGEGASEEAKMSYFKKQLRTSGYTYDKYKEAVKTDLRNQKLAAKVKEQAESSAEATEEVMRLWYDEELKFEKESYSKDLASHYGMLSYYPYLTGVPPIYCPPGYVYIKQIMIMNPEEGEEKDLDAIVAEVQKKLDAGEDFDALLAEYNEDEGAAANPDGYLYNDAVASEYDAGFAEAASKLEDGEISGPVVTQYGTCFLKRDGVREETVLPYEAIEEQIRAYTLKTAKEDAYAEALEKWRGELEIVTYPKRVTNVSLNNG